MLDSRSEKPQARNVTAAMVSRFDQVCRPRRRKSVTGTAMPITITPATNRIPVTQGIESHNECYRASATCATLVRPSAAEASATLLSTRFLKSCSKLRTLLT
jgi:hypothetical protein